ncbi:UDP-Glycosyltransferase/glycogen phosphorylase [Mycena crocata]|nr:UDP-Glycosyltransferase/glycogen phosphorylase [Mycena crocata]
MSLDPTKTRHLLFVPMPAYGHIRPMCALIGRFAADHNIIVTLLIAPNWVEQAKVDIMNQFPSGHDALGRIRVVSFFSSTSKDVFALMAPMAEHYPIAYEALSRGEAIKCSTGTVFSAVPPPTALIVDVFAIEQLRATRSISGTSVPIFMFIAGSPASLLRVFGPESMGGLGDVWKNLDAEALRTGRTSIDLGEEIIKHTEGKVFKVPGMPPMYDYEAYPQKLPFDAPATPMLKAGYATIMECDGIFIGTTVALEGETFAAFEGWSTGTLHKPVYSVGPLLPPGYGAGAGTTPSVSPEHSEIQTFLDSMHSKYGDDSVLFISFGTVFWPTQQEQLEEIVSALTEKKFPFILAHASPFAVISESLLDKINASGLGMATKWSPQQFILSHPATGWFMTHGGHGGVTESLANGVPMICWPFDADQPQAAEHLSQTLRVAFHLIEVRTGVNGLKPMYSGRIPQGTREAVGIEIRDVLEQCRSEVGAEMRNNASRIQGEFAKTWADGGASQMAMQEFFVKYL